MCMLQRRLKIIAMTLVKVKYTKNLLYTNYFICIFDKGASYCVQW